MQDITVNLVNAADYDVPQDIKMVFYIGFRQDWNIEYKFPLSKKDYFRRSYLGFKGYSNKSKRQE